jgi:transcription termination factor NusB
MSGNLNKEYIQNYITKFVSGKVSEKELTKIKKALLNFSQED